MRLAVDTNVVARAMVDDGSEQASLARQCFIEHEIYVPDTVLLETEWLLRSRLALPRESINRLFAGLVSSQSVFFDNRLKIAAAVSAHANGMDFADAIHLLSARDCASMVTFDEDFIKRQKAVENSLPVRRPADQLGK